MVVSPVKFLPGRARLSTKPIATGSLTWAKTTGSVVPVRFVAREAGVFTANMTSRVSRASSAARASRVDCPAPAHRYSIAMFFSSIHPWSRSPSVNAFRNPAFVVAVPPAR